MARRTLLRAGEIRKAVGALAGWRRRGKAIEKSYEFKTYADGLEFAMRVGRQADRRDHHPDLEIGYCRVTVRWSTHDAGGITALDVEGAHMTDGEM